MKKKSLSIIIALICLCLMTACDTSSSKEAKETADNSPIRKIKESTMRATDIKIPTEETDKSAIETSATQISATETTTETTATETIPEVVNKGIKFGEMPNRDKIGEFDISSFDKSGDPILYVDSLSYKALFNFSSTSKYIAYNLPETDVILFFATDGVNSTTKIVTSEFITLIYREKDLITYYFPGRRRAFRWSIDSEYDNDFDYTEMFNEFFNTYKENDIFYSCDIEIDGEKYTYEYTPKETGGIYFDSEGNICRIDFSDEEMLITYAFTSELPYDAFIQPNGYLIHDRDSYDDFINS